MASSTTYGDWMRPIAGGIRNIGKPLTFAGLGVLVVTLMLSMVNVVAAIATAVIGIGTIAVLAVRDREHRNVLDRTVERRSWLSESRKGRALYRSGMLAPVESGECRLPGILSRVSLVEANDGFGNRLTLVRHGHTGEYSLLFACQPQGAALADDDVEDAYVASWAGLLEALGGEAGVTQLAVTVDTSPDSGVRFRRNLAKRTVKDAPELAARAMAQIMDLYATGGASSSVILTLTFRYVDVRDGKFLEPEDAARRIGQLVPNLIRRIADAGGGTARTLTIDEISRMVRVSYDPATQDTLEQADGQPWIEWEDAGPVACEAGWDHYRHDSGVSRTWEMCDPPKSNVTSSTLARLLGPLSDCDRKRVTVVFHVLPPDKTAFMAEQNRQRAANQVSQEKRVHQRDEPDQQGQPAGHRDQQGSGNCVLRHARDRHRSRRRRRAHEARTGHARRRGRRRKREDRPAPLLRRAGHRFRREPAARPQPQELHASQRVRRALVKGTEPCGRERTPAGPWIRTCRSFARPSRQRRRGRPGGDGAQGAADGAGSCPRWTSSSASAPRCAGDSGRSAPTWRCPSRACPSDGA